MNIKIYTSGALAPADTVEHRKPVRSPSLDSDVIVPCASAIITGALFSPLVTIAVHAFRPASDWWMAFPVSFFGISGLAFMTARFDSLATMWQVDSEPVQPALQAPVAVAPAQPRLPVEHDVELYPVDGESNRMIAVHTPMADLVAFARGVANGRGVGQKAWRGFSYPVAGVVTDDSYHKQIVADLVHLGFWEPASGERSSSRPKFDNVDDIVEALEFLGRRVSPSPTR